jgi:hypothetical protein
VGNCRYPATNCARHDRELAQSRRKWDGHCLGCIYPQHCAEADCCIGTIRPQEVVNLRKSGMATAQETIEDREVTHGDYRAQAFFAQRIKEEMHGQGGWVKLSPAQKETLEMIAVKISRVLHGDPNTVDHWTDIAGYATLISNLLTKDTHL